MKPGLGKVKTTRCSSRLTVLTGDNETVTEMPRKTIKNEIQHLINSKSKSKHLKNPSRINRTPSETILSMKNV